MSAGWSYPNNAIFSPWNANFTEEPRQKKHVFYPLNAIFNGDPSKRNQPSFDFFFFFWVIGLVLLWKPGSPEERKLVKHSQNIIFDISVTI